MSKKIKIGITVAGFIEWPGGIEFIKYVLMGLGNPQYELTLLIPDRNTAILKLKNLIKTVLNKAAGRKLTLIIYPPVQDTTIHLQHQLGFIGYFTYKTNAQFVKTANKFDVILPAFYPITNMLKVPVLSYLYDFQYKYFPQFFTKAQIDAQDKHFEKQVKSSSQIIINANSVKDDIYKFFGRSNNLNVIPFTPVFDDKILYSLPSIEYLDSKYGISNKPFFLISNQFWSHKGHKTAINAIDILVNQLGKDAILICTGRFPDPKNIINCTEITELIKRKGLTDRVKMVGFIDKADQLALMINSYALLQPTQFEGGPGGFSVYDAVAYGEPCILSDINVNKEINDNELLTFFKVNDENDLAKKMEAQLERIKKPIASSKLQIIFTERLKTLTAFWDKLIAEMLKQTH
ncbi:glycosyltransferase [Mucilaginibacter sp.]|uniref:glycosyltransferase n=1 Tax=Mucilaginibacter sp. TaxID=1882438 RepID=UPI0035BC37AB